MSSPLATINLVVFNGEKYLRHCLQSVKRQTYHDLEVNIFDNASTDQTREIVRREFPEFNLIAHPVNLGTWPGQEKALEYSHGQYTVALSVDVLLHPEFVSKAVEIMAKDSTIGAVQSKTYQYSLADLPAPFSIPNSKVIDTVGFKIERSRRVINVGHGEEDRGQFDQSREIFGVEGAAPFFRRSALESCRVEGKIVDPDMFWYGDDLDLAWRMHLFDWKQIYSPKVIAYHDRSTTKGLSHSWRDYFRRRPDRQRIPLFKRQLDWHNKRIARLKNDYWANIWPSLGRILLREGLELGYMALFEPRVLLIVPRLIKNLPRTWRKRRAVMAKAKTSPKVMAKYFL